MMKKKVIISSLTALIVLGSFGVGEAKSLIKQGKTPRGNFYTVEQKKVEKNKIAVTIDGNKVGTTYRIDGKNYVAVENLPVKEKVIYDSKTWTKEATTKGNVNMNKRIKEYFSYVEAHIGMSLLEADIAQAKDNINYEDQLLAPIHNEIYTLLDWGTSLTTYYYPNMGNRYKQDITNLNKYYEKAYQSLKLMCKYEYRTYNNLGYDDKDIKKVRSDYAYYMKKIETLHSRYKNFK